MPVTVNYHHVERTEAIEQKINEKTEKILRLFKEEPKVEWICDVDKDHFADVRVHYHNEEYFAKAKTDDLYKSIDQAVSKVCTH